MLFKITTVLRLISQRIKQSQIDTVVLSVVEPNNFLYDEIVGLGQ